MRDETPTESNDDPTASPRGWREVWAAAAQGFAVIKARRGVWHDDGKAVLNGAVGDKLAESGADTALPMGFYGRERPLVLGARDFTPVLGPVTDHLVLLAHGLMATEHYWTMGAEVDFGARLAAAHPVTPVYLRYNTGRHISQNGRELAERIEELVDAWPVPLRRISLIGHSMGGLVLRSATHYAAHTAHDPASRRDVPASWLRLVDQFFLLGSPSRGAPLEQFTHVATLTLRTIPNAWTALVAWALNQRSAGIKDLRHGYLVDEEWTERGPDALSLQRRYPVPLAAGVRHYVMAGTLPGEAAHPLARIVGDALVTPWSARDARTMGRDEAHLAERAVVIPGVSHAALGWNDAVFDQLAAWWDDAGA